MATNISSSFEVILYPTRAARSTTAFSRATMGTYYRMKERPEPKGGTFRLSIIWATEESFTISSLPISANRLNQSNPQVELP